MVRLEIARPESSTTRIVVAALVSAAVAALADTGITAVAAGAGVPLLTAPGIGAVVGGSVVGAVAAVVGWSVVRRRAADARRTMSRLVPAVLVVSLVPDVVLGLLSGWPTAVALASMHVVTAAIVCAVCWRALPLRPRR